MVIVSGDTHGNLDFRKLDNDKVKKQFGVFPSYVIITGDFGVPWSNAENDNQDTYMRKWYEEKPYDIIVVCGNHDNYNRIEAMPSEIYHRAKVRRYTKNIVFVEKNQILELEGKTFYCFGGADSTDMQFRTAFVSWWPQERCSNADLAEMRRVLKNTKEVDYIIAHTAPTEIVAKMHRNDRITDVTSMALSQLVEKLKFKMFYFGHMHEDKIIDEKYRCLYNDLAIIE